jgi:probable rRNA maturation factor
VVVDDERVGPSIGRPVDVDACRLLVADVLAHEGLGGRDLEVHVHVVDEEVMTALNVEHMEGSGPTDVLSFPVEDPAELALASTAASTDASTAASLSAVPLLLGDIVLCPAAADRQAADHTGDFDTEIALLLVHGVLHLLGHDHAEPDEEAVMRERERLHLTRQANVDPGKVRP